MPVRSSASDCDAICRRSWRATRASLVSSMDHRDAMTACTVMPGDPPAFDQLRRKSGSPSPASSVTQGPSWRLSRARSKPEAPDTCTVQNVCMADLTRPARPGRKRGPAIGLAVFGSAGFADNTQQARRHARPPRTAQRLDDRCGPRLGGVRCWPADRRRHDRPLADDPTIAPGLTNEVGIFLGDVVLHEISNARWHVWPNGHPVIRLGNGRELDVTALTRTRVRKGRPHLNTILENAAAAAEWRPTNGTT